MRRTALTAATAIAFAIAVAPATAAAQVAESVTLEASARIVAVGEEVALSGAISPPSAGQSVRILDAAGEVVATASTGTAGRYSVTLRPGITRAYRAAWASATSREITVGVRAFVSARMTPVRLFARVTVRGTVRPADPGSRVEVALVNGGRVVVERDVATTDSGAFEVSFPVTTPGTYRSRASYEAPDLLRGTDVTTTDSTPLPTLRAGSRGRLVGVLERRLVELGYRLVGSNDGVYDARTADAVIAFHKAHGMSRVSWVGAATWRALADPRRPRPREGGRGFHLEVDQTRQLLYTVQDGVVTNILHVSTGTASTPTRDGAFQVTRKIAGFSPNRLYYPSYFDGNRALHGWTEVPTYPASHGCVRIPYWNAIWVYGLADVGTRVVVYH